jgi:hypothetical protein
MTYRSSVHEAISRSDVYELVQLARAHPRDDLAIDSALTKVVPGLGFEKRYTELAFILALPERARPWTAVEAAVQELISLGPEVDGTVALVAQPAPGWTKERAARVLEGTGNKERAEELRAAVQARTTYRKEAAPRAGVPAEWWRILVGYLLGWIVGGACLLLPMHSGWVGDFDSSPFPRFLAPWAFLVGFVGAGVVLSFTWSTGWWAHLKPGRFVVRLVASAIICGAAILVSWFLLLSVLAHGIASSMG